MRKPINSPTVVEYLSVADDDETRTRRHTTTAGDDALCVPLTGVHAHTHTHLVYHPPLRYHDHCSTFAAVWYKPRELPINWSWATVNRRVINKYNMNSIYFLYRLSRVCRRHAATRLYLCMIFNSWRKRTCGQCRAPVIYCGVPTAFTAASWRRRGKKYDVEGRRHDRVVFGRRWDVPRTLRRPGPPSKHQMFNFSKNVIGTGISYLVGWPGRGHGETATMMTTTAQAVFSTDSKKKIEKDSQHWITASTCCPSYLYM